MARGGFKSIDLANAVILVFIFFEEINVFSQNLLVCCIFGFVNVFVVKMDVHS